MSAQDVTPAELSTMLADEIEAVVDDLAIDVKMRTPRKLYCFAPWSGHHKPKLEISIYPIAGKWNDWVEGRFGDALGLVGCVLTRQSDARAPGAVSAAVKWVRERYGIGRADFNKAAWLERKLEAERKAKARAAKAARELADARKMMFGRWLTSHVLTPGDHGWRYLEARGIDFAAFKRKPRAVRFSPEERYHYGAEVRHVGPALMSAMTLHDMGFGSLHRIWIDPARPGEKADLTHIAADAGPRKMFPSSEGAAIRIHRGASGLSASEAMKRKDFSEDVTLCEGLEDGLSIAQLVPEMRVDAVGSLPGLLSYVPYKFTRKLIIAADNDWGKPQAQALLDRACARFEREFQVPVFLARSPEGKDFNDVLRGPR
jgi:hypothetical protein